MLDGRSNRHELDICLSQVNFAAPLDYNQNQAPIAVECCSIEHIQAFTSARDALPPHFKPFLTPYTVDDYLAMEARLFLNTEYQGGFAIIGNQLTSLFSLPGAYLGHMLIALAKDQGAEYLSCYDTNNKLTSMYAHHGFQEVRRTPWNEDLAPAGWDYTLWGRPDFVEMSL